MVKAFRIRTGLVYVGVFSISFQFFFLNFTDTLVGQNEQFHDELSMSSSRTGDHALLDLQQQQHRQCTSPELHVPWPLDGDIPSFTSPLTCGMLGDSHFSRYFRLLAKSMEVRYGDECNRMLRYGVALGAKSTELLKQPRTDSRDIDNCSFMFVMDDNVPPDENDLSVGRYSHNLVPIPRYVLPYKSMRRNAELIKMHGRHVFAWTESLIWQDSMFRKVHEPKSYFKLVQRLGPSCLTAVGLHGSDSATTTSHQTTAAVNADNVTQHNSLGYKDLCDAAESATRRNPTITDSVAALLMQCHLYRLEEHELSISLDKGLIDSTFMIWNQKSTECKEFNSMFACTWFNELHCHSDYDQLPFPYVLGVSGVREKKIATTTTSSGSPDIIKNAMQLVDNDNVSKVQILRSDCHWQFRGLDACISS